MLNNMKIWGADCPFELIDRWIETVNAEFGLSAKNNECRQFFYSIRSFSYWAFADEGYAVMTEETDMWGNRSLVVKSLYLLPEHRTFENLNDLQHYIEETARQCGVKNIVQGTHLGDRLQTYLKRRGYTTCEMRKEI
ncbi:MAG TPA: hypothetical protein DD619_04685 [Alphaproteobacteria bacterium]|nr:hypothetical protein [Alphaproteobacteria bacterium]